MVKKSTPKRSKSTRSRRWRLPILRQVVRPLRAIGRRLPLSRYFRESWRELKRVVWPSRRESLKLLLGVVIFTLVLTLFTTVLDFGFEKIVEKVFL